MHRIISIMAAGPSLNVIYRYTVGCTTRADVHYINTFGMGELGHINAEIFLDVRKSLINPVQTREMPWMKKQERLDKYYKRNTVSFLWAVEDAWDSYNCDDRFNELYNLLQLTVESKARKWAKRFKWTGLTVDDFSSVLWEKTIILCKEYDPTESEYLLFETVRQSLDNVAIDLYRRTVKTNQAKFERAAIPLSDVKDKDETFDLDILNRITVQQILSDPCLTPDERALLTAIYEFDGDTFSLREVSRQLGHKNHKTVQRTLERIRTKLQHHDWTA